MDIVAQIDHWGRSTPNHLAHLSGNRRLTYGELLTQSNALATSLLNSLPAGDAPVLVHGHKEPEMLVAFLGVLKSGRAYIPVDVSLPPTRVKQIAESSQCAAVLTPEDVRQRLLSPSSAKAVFPKRSPHDPHYIIFTSGSTGTPKGVIITSHNLATFLRWMLDEQKFAESREIFLN